MLQRSVGPGRRRRGAAMQGDVFAAPDPHPQLQAVEPIEPPHALLIHGPSLPPQQHPDPQVAEPRPRVGQLADAQPQARSDPALAPAIPGRPTELRRRPARAADTAGRSRAPTRPTRGAVWASDFFAAPPRGCACRATDRRPGVSAGHSRPRAGGAPQLADAQVRVFLLPDVERGFADAELPADIADGRPASAWRSA